METFHRNSNPWQVKTGRAGGKFYGHRLLCGKGQTPFGLIGNVTV